MLKRRAEALHQARVYPLGALTLGLAGEKIAEMCELAEAGCVGFFQADAPLTDLNVLLQAMRYAATFGHVVWVRPQDTHLAHGGVAHEGEVSTRLGLPAIPELAETVAILAILEIAESTGARVHLARLSTARGVALVAAAKARGLAVTCDVGVHHLHLSDRDAADFNAQMNLVPPLRDPRDRDALRRALADGTIDAVCSDHTPVDDDAKQVPFGEAEPGATGLELLLPLVLKWGAQAKLGLAATLSAVTSRPARILGIGAGTLVPGAAADVCLFDPQRHWTVSPAELASQGRNSPFLGLELEGRVSATIVGGRVVHPG
jgi:dihydroorotase